MLAFHRMPMNRQTKPLHEKETIERAMTTNTRGGRELMQAEIPPVRAKEGHDPANDGQIRQIFCPPIAIHAAMLHNNMTIWNAQVSGAHDT
jgi:hypothetical protein